MKCEVFRAEVGTLLTKSDPEYECYSIVYDKKNGYYDTNCGYYLSLSDAKKFIRYELPLNGINDYGIVTSDILNLTPDEIHAIKYNNEYDNWNAWNEDDIVYKEIRRSDLNE